MKSKLLSQGLYLCLWSGLAGYAVLAPAEPTDSGRLAAPEVSALRPASVSPRLGAGQSYLEAGSYEQALQEFERALAEIPPPGDARQEARLHGLIGYALYLQQRGKAASALEVGKRLSPALEQLKRALDLAIKARAPDIEGWVRISLGLVYVESGSIDQAAGEFRQAQALAQAGRDTVLEYQARLQSARIEASPEARLRLLRELASGVAEAPVDGRSKASLLLNLIDQLKQMQEDGQPVALSAKARQLGFSTAERTAALASEAGLPRAESRAEAYLADFHEQEGRADEALRLTERAILRPAVATTPDLGVEWQTRLGRLLAERGQEDRATEAYRRAEHYVAQVRANIPIYYPDGRSSYRVTLEPIYRGLADLLLRSARRTDRPEDAQRLLVEAIHAMEQLKQSELEDYFNNRCILDSAKAELAADASSALGKFLPSSPKSGSDYGVAASLGMASGKTAIFYPILFRDRLELLLVNNGTIYQRTVEAPRERVEKQAESLARILRNGRDYRIPAGQFYRWLLVPLEKELHGLGIDRLIYVPDGVLRLVPLSALGENKDFVARHYVVVTNSGLHYISSSPASGPLRGALLAGLSKPSEDLLNDPDIPDAVLASLSRTAGLSRGSGDAAPAERAKAGALRESSEFRTTAVKALALPEVEKEMAAVGGALPNSKPLSNEKFVREELEKEFKSGQYQVVHISTHSYFGHSADESFIMGYKEILKVDEVEDIMKPARTGSQPVELVTFSACETAQGDDRAPLGFSGLAIKAKARNAIGALWPINDKATRRFMEEYYSALVKQGGDKAKALQQAQLAMLKEPSTAHPSFWAPFILIGSW